jgi:hypothetical protein
MAKAHITTPEGISIDFEGSPRDISAIVEELKKQTTDTGIARSRSKEKPGKVLLVDLIGTLRDGGFFKKPKDLASIKAALEEMGHHYPVTTLSPVMLKVVRKRGLRRLRANGRWQYTG